MTAKTNSTNPFDGMRAAVKDHLGNGVDEVLPGVYRLRRFRDSNLSADPADVVSNKALVEWWNELDRDERMERTRFERHTADIDRRRPMSFETPSRRLPWFTVVFLIALFVTLCLAVWYWVPVTGRQ